MILDGLAVIYAHRKALTRGVLDHFGLRLKEITLFHFFAVQTDYGGRIYRASMSLVLLVLF